MNEQRSSHPLLSELKEWVRKEIPKINNLIDQQELPAEALVGAFRPWTVRILQELDPTMLSKDDARLAIQVIGFGVGSVERHFQTAHEPAGTGLGRFGSLGDFLLAVANVAEHPPRDSHYTYWLWNNDTLPLTFTGDPQEIFFNRAVNHTHELHTSSCNQLRPISEGQVSVMDPDAMQIITTVAQNTMILHEHFRSFMLKDKVSGLRSMEPHFFMTQMRTYLTTYPINGVDWSGVNAANLVAQMQIDYLTGTTVEDYEKTVRARFKFLTREDRTSLEADMALPSLLDLFLRQIGLTRTDLNGMESATLTSLITTQPTAFKRNLASYIDLVHACGRLTSIHWALIQNYLVKASAQLSPNERDRLAVAPERGTGGKTHAQTEAIMWMRSRHPIIAKLMDAMTTYNRLPLAV